MSSNAITDILNELMATTITATATESLSYIPAAKKEAQQALYEAVNNDLSFSGKCEHCQVNRYKLSLLFGVPLADSSKPGVSVEPKDTKSLTAVSTWRGKKLDEYSKAELIEIVCELGQAQQQESYEHSRQLDVLNDLVQKGFKR